MTNYSPPPVTDAVACRVRLLGPVQIERDGQPVLGIKSLKALALLGYVAAQDGPTAREQLAALFWGDLPDTKARANLSWTLNYLGALLPGGLNVTRSTVEWAGAPDYWLDIQVFTAAAAAGTLESLAAASALYRGPFLDGLRLQGSSEFEYWLSGEQERWRDRAVEARAALADHHQKRGDYAAAIEALRSLLAVEPWREEVHCRLMLLLARSGQRSAALAHFQTCRRVLAEELGVEPAAETLALHRRIVAAGARLPLRLPAVERQTSFVDRAGELIEIADLLADPTCRLLTITGPGGVGKTRLAWEVMHQNDFLFLDGVCFVDLSGVTSYTMMLDLLAHGLGAPARPAADRAQQVIAQARERELLLALDGADALLVGAVRKPTMRLLTDLIAQAPHLKLLITSRRRLRLSCEWVIALSGLPWAAIGDGRDEAHAGAATSPAETLFQQRARQAGAGHLLAQLRLADVSRLCALLEGLPLAIEIVAARLPETDSTEMCAAIRRDLSLLTTPHRDIAPRQRSIRAVFDASWRLLTAEEQQALLGIVVFAGAFDVVAARCIARADERTLNRLADYSLLWPLAGGRLTVHALVRQFARDRLAETPRLLGELSAAHARYFADWLSQHTAGLQGPEAGAALELLHLELDNLRAGWAWSVAATDLGLLERYVVGLFVFFQATGQAQQGVEMFAAAEPTLRRAAAANGSAARRTLGRLLARQGVFQRELGQPGAGLPLLTEALEIARVAADQAEQAFALNALGPILAQLGDYHAARGVFLESLALREGQGDVGGAARVRNNLGVVCCDLGLYDEARGHLQAALAYHQAHGQLRNVAAVYANLGMIAQASGDQSAARRHYMESLALCRTLDDRRGMAHVLNNLGVTECALGDYADAAMHYSESLALYRALSDGNGAALALTNLGEVALLRGDLPAAGALCQEALSLWEAMAHPGGAMLAEIYLGRIALARGQAAPARERLLRALRSGQRIAMAPRTLDALAAVVEWLLESGETAQATALAQDIEAHPRASRQTRDRLRQLAIAPPSPGPDVPPDLADLTAQIIARLEGRAGS